MKSSVSEIKRTLLTLKMSSRVDVSFFNKTQIKKQQVGS